MRMSAIVFQDEVAVRETTWCEALEDRDRAIAMSLSAPPLAKL